MGRRPTARTLDHEPGLKAGDKVIVDGMSKLRPGAPVMLRWRLPPATPRRRPRRKTAVHPQRTAPKPAPRPSSESDATMISRFFIDRPIFAAVISLFIVLAGLAAMRVLPIAQYPEIAPPVVTVHGGLSGRIGGGDRADRRRAARERDQRRAEHDLHELELGVERRRADPGDVRDRHRIDDAAVNVNNRVKQVEPRLPEEVRRQGVTVESGSSSFLQVLAFYSPEGRYDDLFISNYVTLNVLDELKRLPGTTNVQIFGAKDYAMRIWVKPDRLAQLKLTPADVVARGERAERAVRRRQDRPVADGKGQDLVYTITTKGRLAEPKEFEQDHRPCRIPTARRYGWGTSRASSWAPRTTSSSAATTASRRRWSGSSCSPAPMRSTSRRASHRRWRASKRFPEGLTYAVPYDTTRFVEVSIREVLFTLGEAMILVFLVVFLFLQSWRATMIPLVAVPVSLLGTFAGLSLLGYSINTLTLFGMVLAIGIVVDDAIVVLENVERIMREEAPRRARQRSRRCTR